MTREVSLVIRRWGFLREHLNRKGLFSGWLLTRFHSLEPQQSEANNVEGAKFTYPACSASTWVCSRTLSLISHLVNWHQWLLVWFWTPSPCRRIKAGELRKLWRNSHVILLPSALVASPSNHAMSLRCWYLQHEHSAISDLLDLSEDQCKVDWTNLHNI